MNLQLSNTEQGLSELLTAIVVVSSYQTFQPFHISLCSLGWNPEYFITKLSFTYSTKKQMVEYHQKPRGLCLSEPQFLYLPNELDPCFSGIDNSQV